MTYLTYVALFVFVLCWLFLGSFGSVAFYGYYNNANILHCIVIMITGPFSLFFLLVLPVCKEATSVKMKKCKDKGFGIFYDIKLAQQIIYGIGVKAKRKDE